MPKDMSAEAAEAAASMTPFPLIRPRLLARAAMRAAIRCRLHSVNDARMPGIRLKALAEAEDRLEQQRLRRAPGYRASHHVLALARLIAAARQDQAKASGSEALRSAT